MMPSQSKAKSRGAGGDSCDLLDLIIDDGPNLTERDVRPLAQQLSRTLSLLHAHGVVHRSAYTISPFLPTQTKRIQ